MNNNLHFRQSNLVLIKLILFLFISIFLLKIDSELKISNEIRKNTSYLISPIYLTAELPLKFYNEINNYLATKNNLIKKNKILEKKIFIQSGIIQNIPLIKEENTRLKKLLNSTDESATSKILVAELIKVNLSPFSNKVILNKGKKNHIYIGQTVIDSAGILGQVSEVNHDFSVVTLITDAGHALLAVNERTGKRIVISGTGDNRYLKAKYISLNEDVVKGDILMTSGLDNIFPEGYLIGEISNINKNFQKDFLEVTASPVSSLSSNREVMLLW